MQFPEKTQKTQFSLSEGGMWQLAYFFTPKYQGLVL